MGQLPKSSRLVTITGLCVSMLLAGCDEAIDLTLDATNPADGCSQYRMQIAAARRTELDKQAEAAVAGAVLGAVFGAALGGSDNRAQGALIGASLGGLVGYSAVYSRQVLSRSKDANNLLTNVNADAAKERGLLTQAGNAAVSLQGCRRSQLASLRSRVNSGKIDKDAANVELRNIKTWVTQDNRIVSAAFNGIGKRVDAYVDVRNATADAQNSISTSSAKARTPNVNRVQAEQAQRVTNYNNGQRAIERDIEVLDVLLG